MLYFRLYIFHKARRRLKHKPFALLLVAACRTAALRKGVL